MPQLGNIGLSVSPVLPTATITVGSSYLNGDIAGDPSGDRGLVLLNAIANLTSANELNLGPGTFNLQTGNQLVIPAGVTLNGAGQGQLITPGTNVFGYNPRGGTILNYQPWVGLGKVQVLAKTGCVVSNLTVWENGPYTGSNVAPMGFGSPDTGGTNVAIENVQIIGGIDSFLFVNTANNTNTAYWELFNVTATSSYDTFVVNDSAFGAFTSFIANIYNCNFFATYDGSHGNAARVIGASGSDAAGVKTINAFGCNFTGNGLSGSAYGAIESGDATINLYGCSVKGYSISNSTPYAPLSADTSTGVINVDAACTIIRPDLALTINNGIITGLTAQLFGSGPPTSASNTANGSTGTATITSGSSDTAGSITITPGGTGIAAGLVATVTFKGPKLNGFPSLTAGNANAAGFGARYVYVSTSAAGTSWTINTTGTPFVTGTPYIFNYTCPGP
jgi:hypothetical protein